MHFQTALDLGVKPHYDLLHGGKSWVSVATLGEHWQQRSYAPHEAVDALQAAADSGLNAYLGQNGLRPYSNRNVSNTVWLNCLFVDLDTYHVPHLHAREPLALIRTLLAEHKELPAPTLYADSGRGLYLIWCFDKPVFCGKDASARLIEWQRTEHQLVQLLQNYAADSKASDAARVLRIPESINTKVGRKVRYVQIAPPVSFWQLSKSIQAAYYRSSGLQPKPDKTPQSEPQKASLIPFRRFNGYSLNFWRMRDYQKIAELRAPMTDYRHRLLFCFTVAACWYCRGTDTLYNEMLELSTRFFMPAPKYAPNKLLKRVSSVVERLEQANAGGKVLWHGNEIDARFKLTNLKIIADLDITESEQRELKTIIGKDERNRRRSKQTRDAYLAEQHQHTEQQRQRCLELRERGLSIRQIAEKAGLKKTRVQQLL